MGTHVPCAAPARILAKRQAPSSASSFLGAVTPVLLALLTALFLGVQTLSALSACWGHTSCSRAHLPQGPHHALATCMGSLSLS